MASLISRRIYRTLLFTSPNAKPTNFAYSFCTKSLSSSEDSSDDPTALNTAESGFEAEADSESFSSPSDSTKPKRIVADRPLENGMDIGIYKAILLGQVGQSPVQKKLRSGRTVTLLSVGTGGIRNNRRPLDYENPKEYANRCSVQWHRVSVYPERLGDLTMKNAAPGSLLYLEGNLETKIFNDPITGLVRRIREIAIRRNGRLVFLGKGNDDQQPSQGDMKRAGYY